MKQLCIVFIMVPLSVFQLLSQEAFKLDAKNLPVIYFEKGEPGLYEIAANMLADDMEAIFGEKPRITSNPGLLKGQVIVIGSCESNFIMNILSAKKFLLEEISDDWERYLICRTKNNKGKIDEVLVVAGSDPRGAAYGVSHLSKLLGVSPWIWWADVMPEPKKEIKLEIDDYISKSPSVRFRGIFLNDEDWGLQPWAAKTFEPESGDIGPKTYKKIFELLLRLRANMIWPAMHPCTKAFFCYPGNLEAAKKYEIFIGTSHAEPMLRNNVDEWDKKKLGPFNYRTNSETVKKYWEDRVIESSKVNGIYTIGMRGVHDSGMEGFDHIGQKAKALEAIISDQRDMLKKHVNSDITQVPQVFTPYKEVLDIYDHGLNVPDDVTIVWTDDNYGYIKRLPNAEEQKRKGGSGVYYHISYWGRPHDYLWLSTTHPLLIWEEMSKAYYSNAKKLWVVNVGDIKPNEYGLDLFLDMAFDMDKFDSAEMVWKHLHEWCDAIVPGMGDSLGNVFKAYYDFAWQRRPEFMGWSQTEIKTIVQPTAFNHFNYGDEAGKRLMGYRNISDKVDRIKPTVPPGNADAFFQLVEYPVKCAFWMNQKFLDLEKSYAYAKQGRLSANEYAASAKQAYLNIKDYTTWYNDEMKEGKWNKMMDMFPRRLPVYELPMVPKWEANTTIQGIHINLEGFSNEAYRNGRNWYLPSFLEGQTSTRFMDVYLMGGQEGKFHIDASADWLVISDTSGILKDIDGKREKRIWLSVNWNKVKDYRNTCIVKISGENYRQKVVVRAFKYNQEALSSGADFVEHRKIVSIHAGNYSRIKGKGWQIIDGLGYTGKVVCSGYESDNSTIAYDFFSAQKGGIKINLYGVPVHPINKDHELGLKVMLDGEVIDTVNFKTFGRSKEWMQNILSNTTHRVIDAYLNNTGKHTLSLQALDPSVFIDRIVIDFGAYLPAYGVVEETRIVKSDNGGTVRK